MKTFDVPQETNSKIRVVAMAFSNYKQNASRLFGLLTVVLFLAASMVSQAHAADVVTTYKDENGWKLLVNGQDFYAKGVVWSYSPRGQNYSYNLWAESDDHIRKVLDYDMGLLKAANVNSIRSFAMIPPKWVTYIYREHGIMFVVNPLMGRYGYMIGGKWVPFTDYSDPLTRATLKADMLAIVNQYKDTPGVLMFAFGNESNYGLSWSSFEIENLPEGEQNTAKARYLYSLFNEVIRDGKKIAPHHAVHDRQRRYPVHRPDRRTHAGPRYPRQQRLPRAELHDTLEGGRRETRSAGDLLRIRIGRVQCPGLQGRPAVPGETPQGTVAGDVQQGLRQWRGRQLHRRLVFEWRDEWWKYLQEENLDTQDNNASWSNQAYLFDWAEGQNNMNEEWFGIAALGKQNADGVWTARPRMAYDVLAEIWGMDPYLTRKPRSTRVSTTSTWITWSSRARCASSRAENDEQKSKLAFTGGRLQGELVMQRQRRKTCACNGENGIEFSDGQMLFLDFEFQPTENLEGQILVEYPRQCCRQTSPSSLPTGIGVCPCYRCNGGYRASTASSSFLRR